MECCARLNLKASPLFERPTLGLPRPAKLGSLNTARPSLEFQGIATFNRSCYFASPRTSSLIALASAESNESKSGSVGTPLEPQTPQGKFLCGILKNQPDIFSFTANKQLEELATSRDSSFARWERSSDSSESYLHKRIAELKELECNIAVQEVMYFLIVHNFYQAKVPMIPNLSKCTNDGRLEIWSTKDEELECVHEPEVLEMVREHLANILRWTGKSDTMVNWTMLKIKKLQLGRFYAASIMYGYFLKSVRLRHRLDLRLPLSHAPLPRFREFHKENLVSLGISVEMESSSLYPTSGKGGKSEKLRGYMMGFDSKTLQICAKLRSQEATNLIENHSWAIFGDPKGEKVTTENDEMVAVSVSGLKRLVLEAVAFGSFLWDAEGHVDSIYRLK
ncbi:UV-B-induced protein-like, chloroplastic [Iris pallida]|uniref:UV-B-induced protein-like, chloroplastic n=1 Tax=Iris pallida TaxID=29817 RepID=A0AAX6F5W6_IRIPA|nr:UV-B-induced protein-like, chloroplastic [Iris pallida]